MAGSPGSAEWKSFDAGFDEGTVDTREPNIKGNFGEQEADYGKADVRHCNVTGIIGDAQFNELVGKLQRSMKSPQALWRLAVGFACIAIPPFVIWSLAPVVASDENTWQVRAAATTAMLFSLLLLRFLAKTVLMVKQGEMYFAQLVEDGNTQLLQAGIHFMPCLGSKLTRFAVTEDYMAAGTMFCIRVRPGFIGLGSENGQPTVLLPGMHLICSPNFEYIQCVDVNDDVIRNGPLAIVRVQPHLVGVAKINGAPVLLKTGIHFMNEPTLDITGTGGFQSITTPVISLGPLQIITVPRGMLAPVLVNGEGHFMLEGRHFINQARFELLRSGIQSLSDEYIFAGTKHRVIVPRGKVGLALEAGEPQVLDPGTVVLKNSPLFQYKGSVSVTQQIINHGSTDIVTVRDGQFGISYKDGVLHLLDPGRHFLTSATHTPAGFISAGQETLRISEVTGMSSDNVELKFDAAVCMRVLDAKKAVTMLTSSGKDLMKEVKSNIQERAKLALSIIIGNNTLNKKHAATAKVDVEDDDADERGFEKVPEGGEEKGGNSFRQVIHDNFMKAFASSMLTECGVQIIDMSVEDIVIVNKELAMAMASAAVANSTLEKTVIDSEIVQVKANADAKVASIEAHGKSAAIKIMAGAEAARIKTTSDAIEHACPQAQQMEMVRTSGTAVGGARSTIMLAQDTNALASLLGGAQGAKMVPNVQ